MGHQGIERRRIRRGIHQHAAMIVASARHE